MILVFVRQVSQGSGYTQVSARTEYLAGAEYSDAPEYSEYSAPAEYSALADTRVYPEPCETCRTNTSIILAEYIRIMRTR